MRVIALDHLTDDTGALAIAGVGVQTHLVHGVQHAAVDGLQPVAGVRQRTLHDDAHCIVEIGLPHLGFDAGYPYVSDVIHRRWLPEKRVMNDTSLTPDFTMISLSIQ